VEETISLSNTQPITKRVIQLKPIQKPLLEEEIIEDSQLQMELWKLQQAKEELESIKKQQEMLFAETEKQINQEKAQWVQERVKLIEQARDEGFQAGFEEGKIESVNQFQNLIEQANSIIKASKIDYQSTVDKSEETILLLAIQVAEKIMKQKLLDQPESFVPIVKDAIQSIKDQRELSIYLHPNNYEYVVTQKSELERVLDSKAVLSIFVNDSLEEGSCIIEHPFGKIDASIDTQLSQIQQVLNEIVMESLE
jgi:flagellar assembly protein FliH